MENGETCRAYLEERECRELAPYALRSMERRRELGDKFREHLERTPLEYRTEYHRDRDRIIWSSAFKRLQHKTQIFPHYVEDHYRRRLTHSIEVAQIATTLCRAFHVNEIAAEAIALAHDIGHTPFGHGGEEALNKKLIEISTSVADPKGERTSTVFPVPLFAFDHCVQGVEQVSRISQEYRTGYPGLNLSFDVRDGILKHIYNKSPDEATKAGRPLSSLTNIEKVKEFAQFGDNCGTIEAQTVWFADKVAYLLGDMEDALRANIFQYADIIADPFVRLIWEKHNKIRGSKEAIDVRSHEQFLNFTRRASPS